MIGATADRARLVVAQLSAQRLDAVAACLALALEQLACGEQRLFGGLPLRLDLRALDDQLLAPVLGLPLALGQRRQGICHVALTGVQVRQGFHIALLGAVVLEQALEQAQLLIDGLGFGACVAEQVLQPVAGRLQLLSGLAGSRLKPGQLFAPLGQPIGDEQGLLQLTTVGGPGTVQSGEVSAAGQLGIGLVVLLLTQPLLCVQRVQLLAQVDDGCLRGVAGCNGGLGFGVQAIQVMLRGERFA